MTSPHPITISGATGALGGLVARRLAERGVPLHLIVRDAGRVPALPGPVTVAEASYGDPAAMRAALAGTSTWLFVSAAESEDRVHQHLTAVDAAAQAGVERVVYTSFLGAAPDATFTLARHHWVTEARLRASGMRYTFLRDSLYLDVFGLFTGPGGVIRGPAGDGRVGAVTRSDIADAAVAVLMDATGRDATETGGTGTGGTGHDGRTYNLTGPRALTLHEIAAELTRASGREVTYLPETLAEAYASREPYGAPDWEVDGWVSTYTAIAAGEMDAVTTDVRTLTGHEPADLADYLAANPSVVARLRTL